MELTSGIFTNIIFLFASLSGLLLVGVLIRAKVKFLQNIFLPASVIGGLIGLLLGPIVLGSKALLPFPEDWIAGFALIPGQLIIPVITAAPLGVVLPKKEEFVRSIGPMFFVLMAVVFMQLGVGTLLGGLLAKSYDLYSTFGLELMVGFWGGHGSAGILGNTLRDLNKSYWEVAQGVATTSATVGIIMGIVLGMALINWAARKKYTSILSEPSDIPEELKVGYVKDEAKQGSIGKFTVLPESIDVVAFHLSIIMCAVGLAFVAQHFIKLYQVPILSSLNVWILGLFVMLIIWTIFNKLGIAWIVDGRIVSRINSLFMEYAIVAAIASLPIKTVIQYTIPMAIIFVIGGILTTVLVVYPLGKKLLPEPWFERCISIYGLSTGVFITGLLLLRITDPEFKTPVLSNLSIAFAINALIAWPYFTFGVLLILSKGIFAFAGLSLALFAVCVLAAYKMTNHSRSLSA